MVVVFCLSYLNIPFTDFLTRDKGNYLILTPDENIYNYLSSYHDGYQVKMFENLDLHLINDPLKWLRIRKNNIRLIRDIKGAEVFFFCISYCHTTLWMVKRLCNCNEVFYQASVSLDKKVRWGFDIKKFLKVGLVYLLLGIRMSLHCSRTGCRLVPSDYFFLGNSIKKIDFELPEKSRSVSNNVYRGDILYLSGDVIGKVSSQFERLFLFSNNLVVEVLESYRTKNKAHPRLSYITDNEARLASISPQIPASSLLDGFKVVIGYSSAVLFDSCNKGINTISLLKYYSFIDVDEILDSMDYLNSNCKNGCYIDYPEDISELKNLLKEYVK